VPEGDTLHKLAAALRPLLVGQEVTGARHRERGPLEPAAGRRVDGVRALGKNLIIALDGGWSFHVHLGIGGSCHQYPKHARWRRSPASATLVIETAELDLVFFRAARGALRRSAQLRAAPGLSGLGPDLLAERVDWTEVLARVRQPEGAGRAIAELLLDQRVAAGIGNVFKCELLFQRQLDPWAAVAGLTDETLVDLYQLARRQLQESVRTGIRATVPRRYQQGRRGPRLWVYQRTNQRCLRCGATVASLRQGELARTTYYCPRCQNVDD